MNMRCVLPYLTSVALLLSAAGCAVRPTSLGGDRALTPASAQIWRGPAEPTPSLSIEASWANDLPNVAIALVEQAFPQTIPATLYTADESCQTFEPKAVDLPADDSIEYAIGQVLADPSVQSIPLAGYRVEQRLSGTVRVDLRFSPDMARSVYSLSSCEQFALFGSIRATLVQNPQWQVTQVIFTESGKELAL